MGGTVSKGILWAIQAVPSRMAGVERLMAAMEEAGLPCTVFMDTNRLGPLASMEFAVTQALRDCRHLVLIQDDTILAPWSLWEMQRAIVGDRVTSFFRYTHKKDARDAHAEGVNYLEVREISGLANYYPASTMAEYLAWSRVNPGRGGDTGVGDDVSWKNFFTATGQLALLTIPDLVQHDNVPSTLNTRFRYGRVTRDAALFGEQFLPSHWDQKSLRRGKDYNR